MPLMYLERHLVTYTVPDQMIVLYAHTVVHHVRRLVACVSSVPAGRTELERGSNRKEEQRYF